jgi:hypothetical protein
MTTRERFAAIYARIALGGAFHSAVAARFGLWRDRVLPDRSGTSSQWSDGPDYHDADVGEVSAVSEAREKRLVRVTPHLTRHRYAILEGPSILGLKPTGAPAIAASSSRRAQEQR